MGGPYRVVDLELVWYVWCVVRLLGRGVSVCGRCVLCVFQLDQEIKKVCAVCRGCVMMAS